MTHMWYWFCLIASVTLVIGAVAAILWWAWRQETASRFADTLDRRFAKEKPKLKWWRTKDWPESTLEQRVTALEKDNRWHRTAAELLMNLEPRLAEVENVMNQIHKLKPPLPLAATPSQVTDASITGANWDVAEQESIPAPFQQSWQSAQPTTNAGRVERFYDSVDPEDVLT